MWIFKYISGKQTENHEKKSELSNILAENRLKTTTNVGCGNEGEITKYMVNGKNKGPGENGDGKIPIIKNSVKIFCSQNCPK